MCECGCREQVFV
uniref:Uncharacterized protein n=1 Tax=Anopheles dirus TaxID=7168 RepID=A0A182NWL4_9DIPT